MRFILSCLKLVLTIAFCASVAVYVVPRIDMDEVASSARDVRSLVEARATTVLAPPPAANPTAAPVPTPAPVAMVAAPPRVDAAAVEAVWRDWMAQHGIRTSAMVLIAPDGSEHGAAANRSPDDRRPVMSLSKAVTGLCMNRVLAEAGLPWDTTLGDIAAQMSAAGVTPRAHNAGIPLAGLVTHSAGLAPDLTQSEFFARTHGALGLHRRFTAAALGEAGLTGTPGTYYYSNTNYAALGVAIEALTGQTYAEACMARMVAPLGLSDVVIEGRYGSLSSYAGWEFSARQYARWARHWFAAGQPHIDAPAAHPRLPQGSYAMGYAIDGRGRGAVAHHSGRMCYDRITDGGVGSLFVATGAGAVFVANWDGCLERAETGALRRAIADLL